MYHYRDHSPSMSLEKGGGVDKDSNKKRHRKEGVQSKKWCSSHNFDYVLFSLTQSLFLHGSSWSSDIITASNKKNPSKKKPTSVSEITIQYLHKNIIILLLSQCGLFIHACVSEKLFVSKDLIYDLFWYNMVHWGSHICKKSSSLLFYIFLEKFNE